MIPQELIQRYFENTLNEGETDDLRAWLAADPANVDAFAAEALIHGKLHRLLGNRKRVEDRLAEALTGTSGDKPADTEYPPIGSMRLPSSAYSKTVAPFEPKAPRPPSSVQRLRRRIFGQHVWVMRGMAAAIIVLATSIAWIVFGPMSPQIAQVPLVPIAHPYIPPTTGVSPIVPVQLDSGFTRLTLDGGVQLLIEGPAEYSVLPGPHLRLNQGRVTAVVPHAVHGFSIITKVAEITDLGTEFGVNAGGGFAETEVFEGRVEVSAKRIGAFGEVREPVRQIIDEDQAYRIDSDGSIHRDEADPALFVRIGDYDERNGTVDNNLVFKRWAAYSNELRKDPSLLAYYTFEKPDNGPDRLVNRADTTQGLYDGTIENALWCAGRFPGKHALFFDGHDSRVKINIPVQLSQLSVAIWVRVDDWNHPFVGLLMSDDWNRTGECHMQFRDGQFLRFGVFRVLTDLNANLSNGATDSGGILGKWAFLATTADTKSGEIVHYCNGIPIGSCRCGAAVSPISIGAAQIGNWNPRTWTKDVLQRGLHGRIDELTVFNRVLSNGEIRVAYEAGRVTQ